MSVPLVPLGEFQPGDIVTGKIVALEPTGALVDFDIDQLVNVPLSELSLCNIQSPDEALRVDEVREDSDHHRDGPEEHRSPAAEGADREPE